MSKKTQILFMMNGLYGGGAEKILQTLLKELDFSKYDITLYSVKPEILDENLYPKDVIFRSVFVWDEGTSSLKSIYIKIKNKIRLFIYNNLSPKLFYSLFIKGSYDVEIAFIEGYSTKIISGSNSKSIKIAWVHSNLEKDHWTSIAYKNINQEIAAYKKFNHIVLVSENVKSSFSTKFSINENLHIKYNPINGNAITKQAQEKLETSLQNNTNVFSLATVGRLEPVKGYDRLINVIKKLKNEGFKVQLNIIGEGTQRKELEAIINKYNLESIVNLLGFKTNPYKYIAASDAFICSSKSEGFSTVVSEALVLGLPVITTNCSGMVELLGDNEYGLITENSEDGIYNGIKKFLLDKEILEHYKRKSFERISFFDIKKTTKEIENLWNN